MVSSMEKNQKREADGLMYEFEEFVEEAVSGMVKKALSLKELAFEQYESWLETATRLALEDDDKNRKRVDAMIKMMTTPSSLFYVGFIHGYASRGSEQKKEG